MFTTKASLPLGAHGPALAHASLRTTGERPESRKVKSRSIASDCHVQYGLTALKCLRPRLKHGCCLLGTKAPQSKGAKDKSAAECGLSRHSGLRSMYLRLLLPVRRIQVADSKPLCVRCGGTQLCTAKKKYWSRGSGASRPSAARAYIRAWICTGGD